MKIIYHFGAHKTASTHLQYNLELNRALLEQNGIKYFRFHEVGSLRKDMLEIRKMINKGTGDRAQLIVLMEKIKFQINEEIKGFETAIISYEGSLGNLNQYYYTSIYEDFKRYIDIFKEILEGHYIIPLYAIRDYDSFIRSSYRYSIENSYGFGKTLNEYISNIEIKPYRWTEIIKHLAIVFNNNPKIFTQEEYKKDSKRIIHAIILLCQKEIRFEKLQFESKKKNVSKNEVTLNYYYTRNTFMDKPPKFRGKGRIYKLMKNNPSFFSTKIGAKLLLHYKQKEVPRLNDFAEYTNEVKLLKEKYGLDYKKHNGVLG